MLRERCNFLSDASPDFSDLCLACFLRLCTANATRTSQSDDPATLSSFAQLQRILNAPHTKQRPNLFWLRPRSQKSSQTTLAGQFARPLESRWTWRLHPFQTATPAGLTPVCTPSTPPQPLFSQRQSRLVLPWLRQFAAPEPLPIPEKRCRSEQHLPEYLQHHDHKHNRKAHIVEPKQPDNGDFQRLFGI
jgi:hypothetical protein